MTRILLAAAEITIPNEVGSASNVGSATVVRIVNKGSTNRVLTVVESDSTDVVGSFTVLGNTSELLEKKSGERIHVGAGTDVLGTKVGYTN
tara:strand:- start:349 stop:621 length:273 start_codon:yes stop_codon:yes gene_type:complete